MTLLADILINVVLLRSLVEPCKAVIVLAVCFFFFFFFFFGSLSPTAFKWFLCHQIN